MPTEQPPGNGVDGHEKRGEPGAAAVASRAPRFTVRSLLVLVLAVVGVDAIAYLVVPPFDPTAASA